MTMSFAIEYRASVEKRKFQSEEIAGRAVVADLSTVGIKIYYFELLSGIF